MTQKKELDCELHCKATAHLEVEVLEELQTKDKSLAGLMDSQEGNTDETKRHEAEDSDRVSS